MKITEYIIRGTFSKSRKCWKFLEKHNIHTKENLFAPEIFPCNQLTAYRGEAEGMIRIAICDDEKAFRDAAEHIRKQYEAGNSDRELKNLRKMNLKTGRSVI